MSQGNQGSLFLQEKDVQCGNLGVELHEFGIMNALHNLGQRQLRSRDERFEIVFGLNLFDKQLFPNVSYRRFDRRIHITAKQTKTARN